jgi:hypothetical protein
MVYTFYDAPFLLQQERERQRGSFQPLLGASKHLCCRFARYASSAVLLIPSLCFLSPESFRIDVIAWIKGRQQVLDHCGPLLARQLHCVTFDFV